MVHSCPVGISEKHISDWGKSLSSQLFKSNATKSGNKCKTSLKLKIVLYPFRHVNRDKWVTSSTSAGLTTAFPPQQWLSLTSWELWRGSRGKRWRLWDLSGQATHWDPQWWSTVVQGLGEQVRSRGCIFPQAWRVIIGMCLHLHIV